MRVKGKEKKSERKLKKCVHVGEVREKEKERRGRVHMV